MQRLQGPLQLTILSYSRYLHKVKDLIFLEKSQLRLAPLGRLYIGIMDMKITTTQGII